jgi:predicted permease
LAPAVQSTRTNLITALKTADVDVPGRRRLWGRNTLVICQVAASVVLLTAAFQLTRAFQERWSGGPGFRTNHLLTMAFDPQLVRFSEAQTQTFYQELLRRARHLPGVKSAALTDHLPMSTEQGGIHVLPEGYQLPAGQDDVSVGLDVAGDGYFDTLGVKMLNGRAFDETDTTASTKVAIVNQQFAQHFWPNGSAIGKRFRLNNQNGPLVQIVGITKNAKYYWIGEPPVEYIYLPFTQRPQARMTLIVESQGPSASLAGSLRELVRNLDAGQPVFNVRTIEDFYQMRVITAPTMLIQTVSAMGLIGLILAIAGLYGLISYNASRRIREIGIRMAIGADAMSVLRMVLRQAVSLVGFGIGIGLLLGLLTERGLNAMFQATGIDVGSYLLILPALITVTMLAAFVPARKASRIEPSRALRYE